MSELRKEMQRKKKNRHIQIESLIKTSIINILAEQEAQSQQAQQPPTQPAQQQQQPQQQEPPPVANTQSSVPKQYTVDDMIMELNAIRSGRSFTDPEIYGRLVTFFKGLDEEHKSNLDSLLTQIAELVTSVDDAEVVKQQQNGNSTQQSQPGTPVDAPQQSAPMPGAQQAVGAAGPGAV